MVVVPPRPVVEMKEKWQQGDFWIEEEKVCYMKHCLLQVFGPF